MSNEHKSAILASIADAETYARREFEYGFEETSERVAKTATAARAEHAEMVAMLRDARYVIVDADDSCTSQTCPCKCATTLRRLDTLLSRVGGGS